MRSLQGFVDFLAFSFKNSVGKSWVEAGRFKITDEGGGNILSEKEWKDSIKPGMTLSMAMVLRKRDDPDTTEHNCPACEMTYTGEKTKDLERVKW